MASTFPSEETVEYEYGGNQKRRERDDGTTVTWYNYDRGWNLLSEENGGTLAMTYVHDPRKPIGTALADLAGTTPATGTARYYLQDNIGSTRQLRDAIKGSLGEYEYEPYGGVYSESGATASNKFSGHMWDSTCKLYFAPYRYFEPSVARWLTRDPLGLIEGTNLYVYVSGDPIFYFDPAGLQRMPGESTWECIKRHSNQVSNVEWFIVGSVCGVCGIIGGGIGSVVPGGGTVVGAVMGTVGCTAGVLLKMGINCVGVEGEKAPEWPGANPYGW